MAHFWTSKHSPGSQSSRVKFFASKFLSQFNVKMKYGWMVMGFFALISCKAMAQTNSAEIRLGPEHTIVTYRHEENTTVRVMMAGQVRLTVHGRNVEVKEEEGVWRIRSLRDVCRSSLAEQSHRYDRRKKLWIAEPVVSATHVSVNGLDVVAVKLSAEQWAGSVAVYTDQETLIRATGVTKEMQIQLRDKNIRCLAVVAAAGSKGVSAKPLYAYETDPEGWKTLWNLFKDTGNVAARNVLANQPEVFQRWQTAMHSVGTGEPSGKILDVLSHKTDWGAAEDVFILHHIFSGTEEQHVRMWVRYLAGSEGGATITLEGDGLMDWLYATKNASVWREHQVQKSQTLKLALSASFFESRALEPETFELRYKVLSVLLDKSLLSEDVTVNAWLLLQLKDTDAWMIREMSHRVMVERNEATVLTLQEGLNDPYPRVRAKVAELSAKLPALRGKLIALATRDSFPLVRVAVLKALNDAEGVWLNRIEHDPNARVRRTAIERLVEHGNLAQEDWRVLRERIEDRSEWPDVLMAALKAMDKQCLELEVSTIRFLVERGLKRDAMPQDEWVAFKLIELSSAYPQWEAAIQGVVLQSGHPTAARALKESKESHRPPLCR